MKSCGKNMLLVTVVSGILILCLLQGREPRYQGKTLSRWLRGLEYDNVNPKDEQRFALCGMGEPAVDWLIRMLRHRDSYLKRRFVAYAETHPNIHNRFIAPRYVVPENLMHSQAATALGEI